MTNYVSVRNPNVSVGKAKRTKKKRTRKSKVNYLISKGATDKEPKTVAQLSKFVDTTLHFQEVNYDTGAGIVVSSPALGWVTQISQGAGESNRIGQHIKLNYTAAKGYVARSATATVDQIDVVRVMVFVDKECRGAYPTILDLMQNSLQIFSYMNNDSVERFVTLMDKTFIIDRYHPTRKIKFYKYLNTDVHYRGNASAITDAGENNIFVLFWNNQIATPANNPYIYMNFRNRFVP